MARFRKITLQARQRRCANCPLSEYVSVIYEIKGRRRTSAKINVMEAPQRDHRKTPDPHQTRCLNEPGQSGPARIRRKIFTIYQYAVNLVRPFLHPITGPHGARLDDTGVYVYDGDATTWKAPERFLDYIDPPEATVG